MNQKIVLDSNILIAFNDLNLIDLLNKILDEESLDFMIPSDVLFECHRTLRNNLTNNLKEVIVDKGDVKELREEFERLHKPIHTKKDKDYQIVTLAMKEKVNMLISNDRDIIIGTRKYKEEHGYSKEQILLTTLATFLKFIYEYKKSLFTGKQDILVKYFEFFKEIEMPNCYDGIKNRKWDEHITKKIVDPYKKSIIEIAMQ